MRQRGERRLAIPLLGSLTNADDTAVRVDSRDVPVACIPLADAAGWYSLAALTLAIGLLEPMSEGTKSTRRHT